MGTEPQRRNPIRRVWSGLGRLARLILRLPGGLLRLLWAGMLFILTIPWWLWRGQVWLGRFLVNLPGRLWRGLERLVRFLVGLFLGLLRRLRQAWAWLVRFLIDFVRSLPGWLWRLLLALLWLVLNFPFWMWRSQIWLGQFLVSLPDRLRRGLRRIAQFVASLPGRLARAWRRFRAWAVWPRRPVLLSPRATRLLLLIFTISLGVIILLTAALLQTRQDLASREAIDTVAAVAAEATVRASQPAVSPTPGPSDAVATRPALAAPLTPPVDWNEGAIAFILRRDGNSDLYALNLADRELVRLTHNPAEERDPAWAPDGETVAFASRRNGNWDVYQLDLVSGVLIRMTRSPHYDGHPSWSNDGRWLAFESYRGGNLDIYIMAVDRGELVRLTANRAADMSPAWSPDGRHILFVSYRDGSQDIFVYSLDVGTETGVVNLTQTPDRDEGDPCWSPDGRQIAFSVGRSGQRVVYVTPFDTANQSLVEAQLRAFEPGEAPAWSPSGSSMVYSARQGEQFQLQARSLGEKDGTASDRGEAWTVFDSLNPVDDPSWTRARVHPEAVGRARSKGVLASSVLYVESIAPPPESGPPYGIVPLENVNGGSDREFLSDRVDDSFVALRQRVIAETGYDYLATLGDSFRAINAVPREGQPSQGWHKAGRAFDLSQGFYERDERLIELVREDIGLDTYWRVYFKTALQDGSLGAPLSSAPWDLKATGEGAAASGGGQALSPPPGYYADFTALAQDYGWERAPAMPRWTWRWTDSLWWQYQKTWGQSWLEAMLEIYPPDQIEAVFGPLDEIKGKEP